MAMISSEEFWGCELSAISKSVEWDFGLEDIEDDSTEHKLVLSQACLGVTAKDNERNIVQVTVYREDEDGEPETTTHTILSLRVGLAEQTSLSLGFTSKVKFELVSGSGPVHLVGSHLIAIQDDIDLDRFEHDDEAGLDSELEDYGSESDDDDDEGQDDDSDDEDQVEEVGTVMGKSLKRPSPTIDSDSKVPKSKLMKKGILKKAAQDSDDDDSDDDSEQEKTPSKKNVTFSDKVQVKKIGKVKSGNVAGAPAKKNDQVNLEEVKQKIKNNKSRPKTFEKFKNFVKGNFKVTDEKTLNVLWDYTKSL